MEPLDDHELSHLLREWTAPPVPRGLESPWPRRRGLRGWLTSSVRIPVPVALAVIGLIGYLTWSLATGVPLARPPVAETTAPGPEPAVASLSGFRPLPEVQARRLGEAE
jgi:hypothetical protein